MRILVLGDIVGENTIKKLEEVLPQIKIDNNINFTIANGENVTNARGIDKKSFFRLLEIGVNVITMGNHTFSNPEINDILEEKELIIPANSKRDLVQKGYGIFNCKNQKIFVGNLLGRACNPELKAFDVIEEIIKNIPEDVKIRLIDFHGEFANEKKACAYFMKEKISALYGTHTHVQTADEQILKNGIGYITDIGMCGPKESAIGYDIDFEIKRYTEFPEEDSKLSTDSEIMINGCIFDIDDNTGKTTKVKRIYMY